MIKSYNTDEIKQAEKIEEINYLFESMKRAKANETDETIKDIEFEQGKQIAVQKDATRSDVVINLCKKAVLRETALLSQIRPMIKVTPIDDDDEEFAAQLGSIIYTVLMNILDFHKKGRRTFYNLVVQGNVPWELSWNSSKFGGEFELNVWDFINFYSETTKTFDESKRFMLVYPEEVGTIKQQYGVEVQPEGFLNERITRKGQSLKGINQSYSYNNDDSTTLSWIGNPHISQSDKYLPGRCLKKKFWDFSDPEKYPNGRVIITAGNRILIDKENPYKHGKSDIVLFNNEYQVGTLWCAGDIRYLRQIQRGLNKMVNQFIDNVNFNGNAINWTDDPELDIDRLSNNPKNIYRLRRGSQIGRTPGWQIPSTHFELFSVMRAMFDSMTGLYDAFQGRNPQGASNSGRAILALQRASQILIDLKATLINETLTDFGNILVSMILQQYTLPRRLRITHNNQTQFGLNMPGGVNIPEEKRNLRYDVEINIGENLPHNREFMYQVYREMYGILDEMGKPLIPSALLLKASGIPDANKIIQDKLIQQQTQGQTQMPNQFQFPTSIIPNIPTQMSQLTNQELQGIEG